MIEKHHLPLRSSQMLSESTGAELSTAVSTSAWKPHICELLPGKYELEAAATSGGPLRYRVGVGGDIGGSVGGTRILTDTYAHVCYGEV